MRIPGPGKAELVYTAEDGTETRELIHNFTGAGVIQGMHNLDNSIESFARSCFEYALSTKQDLWFASKDTISKKYDHRFKDIFQEIFDAEYKEKFAEAGITYFYTLIDDVRKTVPSSMARIVPFGLFHISFRLYSVIRAAFGVMVAHLTATPYFLVAFAESTVT